MDIFNAFSLLWGLCLFLFGMNLMGEALERRAGNGLRTALSRITTKKVIGFLTGLGVTAVIQSSSAATVMVVGFVNSGLMSLRQAINVIMGANVGTTVTAWLFSLSGIDSGNTFIQLLKPTAFTPVLAFIGIIFYIFRKSSKSKDIGIILLSFATLMFGMDAMANAVSGLRDVPEFRKLFILFTNPVLGVIAGAVFTAIIQSSTASVGILQALASAGQMTYAAAIPIIMGQNIGTCITTMLAGIGANKDAKRAAMVHLFFNVIGTAAWLTVFWIIKAVLNPVFLSKPASLFGIAVAHSVFNILCTALLIPLAGFVEKTVIRLVPDNETPETNEVLDERLLATPSVALRRSREVTFDMANCAFSAMYDALAYLKGDSASLAESVRSKEEKSDRYEDSLGSYLVKLSACNLGDDESAEAAMLLKSIGDFERISDHSINVLEAAEELEAKGLTLSKEAKKEIKTITSALEEIMELSLEAFRENSIKNINSIESLEQVIDILHECLRTNHIARLQQGNCTIDVGFVWSDLLTDFERVADHCSNIAGSVMDFKLHDMNIHENLRAVKSDNLEYKEKLLDYMSKYALQ